MPRHGHRHQHWNQGWQHFQDELDAFDRKLGAATPTGSGQTTGARWTPPTTAPTPAKAATPNTRKARRTAIFAGKAIAWLVLVVATMFGAGGGILAAATEGFFDVIGWIMISIGVMMGIASGASLIALGAVKKTTERSDAQRTVERLLREHDQVTDLLLARELQVPVEQVHASMKALAFAGIVSRDVDESTGREVYRERNLALSPDEQDLADFDVRLSQQVDAYAEATAEEEA